MGVSSLVAVLVLILYGSHFLDGALNLEVDLSSVTLADHEKSKDSTTSYWTGDLIQETAALPRPTNDAGATARRRAVQQRLPLFCDPVTETRSGSAIARASSNGLWKIRETSLGEGLKFKLTISEIRMEGRKEANDNDVVQVEDDPELLRPAPSSVSWPLGGELPPTALLVLASPPGSVLSWGRMQDGWCTGASCDREAQQLERRTPVRIPAEFSRHRTILILISVRDWREEKPGTRSVVLGTPTYGHLLLVLMLLAGFTRGLPLFGSCKEAEYKVRRHDVGMALALAQSCWDASSQCRETLLGSINVVFAQEGRGVGVGAEKSQDSAIDADPAGKLGIKDQGSSDDEECIIDVDRALVLFADWDGMDGGGGIWIGFWIDPLDSGEFMDGGGGKRFRKVDGEMCPKIPSDAEDSERMIGKSAKSASAEREDRKISNFGAENRIGEIAFANLNLTSGAKASTSRGCRGCCKTCGGGRSTSRTSGGGSAPERGRPRLLMSAFPATCDLRTAAADANREVGTGECFLPVI
ncbi:hypothetical protein C8F01DRAFT_1087920 [Mycena amicta]|nr:hypothetical protein C8F01DRAFT_1087920 [Mycena amicta]